LVPPSETSDGAEQCPSNVGLFGFVDGHRRSGIDDDRTGAYDNEYPTFVAEALSAHQQNTNYWSARR
jgi:hypothetical protein